MASDDRMFDPHLQRTMARKIGAQVTLLQTSHAQQQSRPEVVAKVVIAAVTAATK